MIKNLFRLFPGLLAILFLQGAGAAEEVEPTPEEVSPDEAKITRMEADHLVPPTANPGAWSMRYTKDLRTRLGIETPFYCEMLVKPSFSAEHVVSFVPHGSSGTDPAEEKKLMLRYAAGDTSIWYAMPENNDEKKQKEVKVEVITIEFPKELGIRVYKLWDRMIGRVRYSKKGTAGLDGTTIEFASPRGRGKVWSPRSRQSPLLLTEVGYSLIACCKASDERRADAMKELEVRMGILEKYLDEHPVDKE